MDVIHDVPKGLASCDLKELHEILGRPTLLHIRGSRSDPLFISTLLHGNETTSFEVLQRLLKKYEKQLPQRDIIFFIGNTRAASKGLRQLEGGLDFNRIWSAGNSQEHKMAEGVFEYARQFNLFANVDIHNNTGNNPYYACVNLISDVFLNLAKMFSDTVVYFTEPSEVQSMKFAELCPSVTLEAGISGDMEGVEKVYNFIEKLLHLEKIPEEKISNRQYDIFHTVGRMKISKSARIAFEEENLSEFDLSFVEKVDHLNFNNLERNQCLGRIKDKNSFYVIDNHGRDVTSDFFSVDEGIIKVVKNFTPAMISKNKTIIKSDCFGYVMEKLDC